MELHLRGPHVMLLLATLHVAALKNSLREISKSRTMPESDCFSPYDGKPLLKVTKCTPDLEIETKKLMSMGTCVCFGGAGELLTPLDGCCTSAPLVCDVKAVARLQAKFEKQVTMVNNNTGDFYRNAGGTPKTFLPGPAEVDIAEGGVSRFYRQWRNLKDQQHQIKKIVDSCSFAQLIEIGKSFEHRPIHAVRFTGKNFEPGKSLKMLLTFQVHAREWISGMSGVYVIERIARHVKEDPAWLGDEEIVILPMVNPDGFIYSEKSDRLWRKNMRPNNNSRTILKCDGVDLNRNFPTSWGTDRDSQSGHCSEIFPGETAASEPETQAVIKMVDEGNVCLHIDYHSFSELILAPWSYTNEPHPEREQINKLMTAMNEGIKSNSGKHYLAGGNEILYPAAGIGPDYTTEQGGWGITVELSPSNTWGTGGFLLPEAQIPTVVVDAFASFNAARGWMKQNGCSGRTKR